MPRYVDADKMLKFIKETNANYHWLLAQYNASWIYDFIESQPTADVVPMAEVEQLKHKYDLAVAEREANVKGFTEQLSRSKAEAIEEFAERLKEWAYAGYSSRAIPECVFVSVEQINDLVKEMTEAGK